MLWEQHTAWTRMAIMSIVFGLPDEKFSVKRLLQNLIDFANAFRPFYGDIIASKFGQLITDHLTIAAELVKTAKAGDSQKAVDMLNKDYQKGVETYDKLEAGALEMADTMVNGIIAQFAYYFCY